MTSRPRPPGPAPFARASAERARVPGESPTCERCGRVAGAHDLVCEMCGQLLPKPVSPVLTASVPEPSGTWTTIPLKHRRAGRQSSLLADLRFLAVGILLAPILAATPMLRYVGWFLKSLFHETGHAAMGWALGCPAYPAIRLDGHAAAVHAPQSVILCVGWMVLLAALAYGARRNPVRLAVFAGALVLYPLFAFTSAKEAAFLLAGHVGELVFAGILLVQAVDGGLSGEPAERAAHSMVGWYLVGSTLWLCGGLIFSETARAGYESSGSFGLENDLLRLSREVLPLSLGTLAGTLLLLALATPAIAFALGRRRSA